MLLASPGYDGGDVEVVAPVVLVHAPPLGSRGELRANSWGRGRHLGRRWGREIEEVWGPARWFRGLAGLIMHFALKWMQIQTLHGGNRLQNRPTSQQVRLISLDLVLGFFQRIFFTNLVLKYFNRP